MTGKPRRRAVLERGDALDGPFQRRKRLGAALALQDVALHVDDEERGVGTGHAPADLNPTRDPP
jgi:hypothetical protein